MRRKAICLLVISFLIIEVRAGAQDIFIGSGKIEYEKRVNIHRQIAGRMGDADWAVENSIESSLPVFLTSHFTLYFDNHRTLYEHNSSFPDFKDIPSNIPGPAQENTVFKDLTAKRYTTSKAIFGHPFLISDAIQNLKWRITPEIKVIAGMKCRRAFTIIMDSVYVIAFYSEEITTSGGPESFSGLPGMILGLVIPRIDATWFATKVSITGPPNIAAPKNGEPVDKNTFVSKIENIFKSLGAVSSQYEWLSLL